MLIAHQLLMEYGKHKTFVLGLVRVMQEDLLTLSERWESGGGKKMH